MQWRLEVRRGGGEWWALEVIRYYLYLLLAGFLTVLLQYFHDCLYRFLCLLSYIVFDRHSLLSTAQWYISRAVLRLASL